MKKIIIFCAMFLSSGLPILGSEETDALDNTPIIEVRKDVLVWKYKSINGHVYKRLYNQTKGRWEGPWIKC